MLCCFSSLLFELYSIEYSDIMITAFKLYLNALSNGLYISPDIQAFLLAEWSRYAEIETREENDAQRLSKWLVKKCTEQKTDRINYSNIQTSCPRPMQKNTKLLEMIIQQLNMLIPSTYTKAHVRFFSFYRHIYIVMF